MKNVNFDDYNLNFTLESNNIIGITGKNSLEVLKFLSLPTKYQGQIYCDEEKITKQNILKYKEKVSLISKMPTFPNYLETVNDYMLYIIRNKQIITKNDQKKSENALKVIGLNPDYKNKKLIYLSKSEKKLVQIAASLLSNPEIILLDEPFSDLDLKHQKNLLMLLQKIQEQYGKIILISTEDSNYIYKYIPRVIMIKNKKVFYSGKTREIYERVDYLRKNKFSIPSIVDFTYQAKKEKNIKIDYHQDIRDLIKDIYKHV